MVPTQWPLAYKGSCLYNSFVVLVVTNLVQALTKIDLFWKN